jgi:hypothetical protein
MWIDWFRLELKWLTFVKTVMIFVFHNKEVVSSSRTEQDRIAVMLLTSIQKPSDLNLSLNTN